MNDKLALLATNKDFADLMPEEREQVLAEMSPVAFDQLGQVLRSTAQLDARLVPPPRIKQALLDRMRALRKPSLPARALALRIPVWQALALICIAFAWHFFDRPQQIKAPVVAQVQLKRDTVWEEKVLWKDRVVWREKIVYREKPVALDVASKSVPDFPELQNLQLPQPEPATSRVGTSLGDAPELMRFFTQGDK